MSQECSTGCGRPMRDTRQLCDQCVWVLERALAEMPALLDELSTTLTRQAVMSERSDGGRSAETPVPFHVEASDKLDDLRTFLVGWVRDIAETYEQDYPPDTLRAMSRWLLARLDIIAQHSAASDIWDEIVGVTRDAWRLVDRAANRTRFEVGPCPEVAEEDGAQCPGEVWAFIPTHESSAARLECRSCGTRWETHQWLRAGKRILAEVKRRATSDRPLRAIFGNEHVDRQSSGSGRTGRDGQDHSAVGA